MIQTGQELTLNIAKLVCFQRNTALVVQSANGSLVFRCALVTFAAIINKPHGLLDAWREGRHGVLALLARFV